MTVVINELIDPQVLAGARARIRYSTDIITVDGGHEVRNSRWRYPLHQFEFDCMPGSLEDDAALEAFIDLFHAAGGAHGIFRFHFWGDKPAVGQHFGTGDGSTTEFQLYRIYTRGEITRTRKITRPVEGTVTIYSNGTPVAAGVDYDTGVVIFAPAPPLNAILTADFEFDVPVRFADDELEMVGIARDLDQPVSVIFVEVKEGTDE